jgi:hypothetical protein
VNFDFSQQMLAIFPVCGVLTSHSGHYINMDYRKLEIERGLTFITIHAIIIQKLRRVVETSMYTIWIASECTFKCYKQCNVF